MEIIPDLSFEYDYVRVVYEFILNKLRTNKKIIEKEINTIVLKLGQIKKKITHEKKIGPEIIRIFETMSKRLNDLEDKYNNMMKEEDNLYSSLEERIKQLKLVDFSNNDDYNKSSDDIAAKVRSFCDKKLNNMLVEFLLQQKKVITAKTLIKEEKIKDSVELAIYSEIDSIVESIHNKSLTEALSWCNQNKSKLSKINSNLKFKIEIQQLLELIITCYNDMQISKTEKTLDSTSILDCIKFAKEAFNLKELTKQEKDELESILILLMFNWKTIDSYPQSKLLLNENRWEQLEKEIKETFFKVYSMKPYSSLEILFQCGLMALKTPLCSKGTSIKVEENNNLDFSIIHGNFSDCPTCDSDIYKLTINLPCSQHSVSSLLCRRTKKIMDHNNPPLATNQGYLYCSEYVNEEINLKKKFFCEEENKNYELEQLKKVYLV